MAPPPQAAAASANVDANAVVWVASDMLIGAVGGGGGGGGDCDCSAHLQKARATVVAGPKPGRAWWSRACRPAAARVPSPSPTFLFDNHSSRSLLTAHRVSSITPPRPAGITPDTRAVCWQHTRSNVDGHLLLQAREASARRALGRLRRARCALIELSGRSVGGDGTGFTEPSIQSMSRPGSCQAGVLASTNTTLLAY